jgi:hypothetical protein
MIYRGRFHHEIFYYRKGRFIMAWDKEKIVEKLKGASPEERTLFREALQEAEPGAFLSMEELSTFREMLEKAKKTKTKKSLLDIFMES